MIYGILAGNKLHLSEIARFLKESITLKKTIDRLSRNLNLLAMLAVGYIGLTTAVHKDSIFLAELKGRSKRIYKMPKFIFYAMDMLWSVCCP